MYNIFINLKALYIQYTWCRLYTKRLMSGHLCISRIYTALYTWKNITLHCIASECLQAHTLKFTLKLLVIRTLPPCWQWKFIAMANVDILAIKPLSPDFWRWIFTANSSAVFKLLIIRRTLINYSRSLPKLAMNTAIGVAMTDSLPLKRYYFCLIAIGLALPRKVVLSLPFEKQCTGVWARGPPHRLRMCTRLHDYRDYTWILRDYMWILLNFRL